MALFGDKGDYYGRSWPAIVIGLFVAFGGILFGYDTGTIGGIMAMGFWRKEFGFPNPHYDAKIDDQADQYMISSEQKSVVVSILSVGTFFGALSSPLLADRIGRRWGLFASCWVFNLGVVLQTAAVSLDIFDVGRFFAGAGVGLISALVPLYQSETAPKWIRGFIVGAYQLAITIGILLAAIVNNSSGGRDDPGSYRIPTAVQFAWSLILMIGLLFLPETPRFLIKRGHRDDAKMSLARIRRVQPNDPNIESELQEIEANHNYELSIGKARYIDCFIGTQGKRQVTGMLLQMFQQLTGVNFIFYYGTEFFKGTGLPGFKIAMVMGAVNTLSTFPGMFLVDKLGRRKLLLIGAIGMATSQCLVAVCGMLSGKHYLDDRDKAQFEVTNVGCLYATVAFSCMFISFFAATWGPLAWIICGELYPLKFRARGLSITTATNWLLNWAIAFATPFLVDPGPHSLNLQAKIFFIWFVCCFTCIAFAYFMVYETKDLTLEQVDQMYEEVKSARQSPGWKPAETYVQKNIGAPHLDPPKGLLEKGDSEDDAPKIGHIPL
ncbi:major facilitator superfamily transporter monosaccharide [Zalerion maritima]|uniref:Major facilitator superfamily transporter monosaccharide n=1 Tax=Zalerion maritima TaxID=339359 RepID=A0AAD5WNL6_9PEZI|nr:major facilitator superfamily transporter monosaccharide [Zalerion maritima]